MTDENTPFEFGQANVIRFRGEDANFAEAFETVLASDYENEDEDLTIIACGPMVPEAMRAAWILKSDFGYETRVVNLHTLKPMDDAAILRAARETGVIVTAEEHQIGALAWRVSSRDHGSAAAVRSAGDHGRDRSERPLWRFGRALGADQGIRGQRGTHREEGSGVDAGQEDRRSRGEGRIRWADQRLIDDRQEWSWRLR